MANGQPAPHAFGAGLSGISTAGAVDLGALAAAREAQEKAEQRAASGEGPTATSPVVFAATADTFQQVMELSMTVPVLVDFGMPSAPESVEFTALMTKVVQSYQGILALATVNVEVEQQLAMAFQLQAVPAVVALLGGQPAPLFTGIVDEASLRQLLDKVIEIAQQQGVTGSLASAEAAPGEAAQAEAEAVAAAQAAADQRYAAAEAAAMNGDWAGMQRGYEEVLAQDPADQIAKEGVMLAIFQQRIQGLDSEKVKEAAQDPANLSAQFELADLHIANGQQEQAFELLLAALRRTQAEERTQVRDRLVELFEIIGDDAPLVLQYRREMANALF